MVCDLDDPDRLAFPLRRGLVWRRRVSELRTEGAGGPAAGDRVAVQRCAVPGGHRRGGRRAGSAAVRPRRRGGVAPAAGALGAAVRHLFGRNLFAPLRHRRVQADPRRADAHPVPRRRDQALLHLPQPRLPVVAARACASCCRRSGCGSAGTSWCRAATPRVCASGFGCAGWAVGRSSGGRDSDVHRRRRSVQDDESRVARPGRRVRAAANCGCTWAGRTSSSATAASVLGPFWITIATGVTAVAMGGLYSKLFKLRAVRASALRHARPDHLEPDQRRDPRGRRRVRRQRGPDQAAADAAVACTSTGWCGGR